MTVNEIESDTGAEDESSAPELEKKVIIAGSGDLDKTWPVMLLATTGLGHPAGAGSAISVMKRASTSRFI